MKKNNNSIVFPSLDSMMTPDYGSEGYLVHEKNVQNIIDFFASDNINEFIKSNNKIVWDNEILLFPNKKNQTTEKYRRTYLVSSSPAISSGMIQTPKAVVSNTRGLITLRLIMTDKN